MGMSVFSGMTVATIIGVILIPAFFVMIEGKKKAAKKAAADTDTIEPSHHA